MARIIDVAAAVPCSLLNQARVRAFLFHSVRPSVAPASDIPTHNSRLVEDFFSWLESKARTVPLAAAIAKSDESGGTANRLSPVLLTFDDAFEDNYTVVFPALLNRGLTAAFFIPTALADRKGHLTRAMIREMSNRGMSIGSHTVTHPHLSRQSPRGVRRELTDSKLFLEDLTGRECASLAYPYGDHTSAVRMIAREAGYRCCFTGSPEDSGSDRWKIGRSSVPAWASKLDFIARVYGGYQLRKQLTKRLVDLLP